MKKYPLLYAFIVLLFLLTIFDLINPEKIYSELENRKLASKVKFTVEGAINGSFSKKYEEYINDQFIGRDLWIDLKSRSEYVLGKIENNGVIYGKNNYLFDKFDALDTDRVITNINALNIFIKNAEELGSDVSVMIVPSSYEVYKEMLPEEAPLINQEEEIKFIYNELDGGRKLNIVKLFQENKENQLYYKTDHHWNINGAYLAYKDYIEEIGEKPINLNELKENNVDNFYGTFFSKAKPFKLEPDVLTYYDISNIEMKIGAETYDSLYDFSYLNARDKYSIFLRGNNPLTIIKNRDLNNGKKLLVIKDSFANSMVPFLTQNFEEIHVIDLRAFMPQLSNYISEEKFNNILVLYNFMNFSKDTNLIKFKF
ncbi:DHHW family protein [Clostridium culturomicium]|uniref:DHHW family protein n=1 Tax=Clostridium culturomicium TaxID=1499683 RepID=UPI00058FE836|nr:DHHW family protein [Clostridium culturomicium]